LTFLTELLAAIPSIVYGLWGIFVLVPVVRQLETSLRTGSKDAALSGAACGVGMLSAALILRGHGDPFTSSVAREVLKAVPPTQREAAYALGRRGGRPSRRRFGTAAPASSAPSCSVSAGRSGRRWP
jgi:phosphate transport system permease protein